ncbi:MAG: hypothetical protein ABH851_01085 [Methanobacteriota archaeon]
MMKKLLLASLFLILFTTGCLNRGSVTTTIPPVYINPCNIIGENILVQASGSQLTADILKTPLAKAYVDDILNSKTGSSDYTLSCWWGKNIGEKSDQYYCSGSYTSPETSSEGVINRYIKKSFKLGFDVEEQPGGSWSLDGKTYNEPTKYYVTVNSVEATCVLV